MGWLRMLCPFPELGTGEKQQFTEDWRLMLQEALTLQESRRTYHIVSDNTIEGIGYKFTRMYMRGLSFEDELGLEGDTKNYTQIMDLKLLPSEKFKNSWHAAHCMIYALNNRSVMKAYHTKASILMQLRFDGHFGFPGGIVEKGETPEEAVAREMEEEMGILRHNVIIFPEDHVVTHYSEDKDLLLHFFTKEVSFNRLLNIEARAVRGHYYGDEVMGIVRIPLYTMADGYRGFPAFLNNRFIGNSKEQLLHALVSKELFTSDEIQTAMAAKPRIISKINNIKT